MALLATEKGGRPQGLRPTKGIPQVGTRNRPYSRPERVSMRIRSNMARKELRGEYDTPVLDLFAIRNERCDEYKLWRTRGERGGNPCLVMKISGDITEAAHSYHGWSFISAQPFDLTDYYNQMLGAILNGSYGKRQAGPSR